MNEEAVTATGSSVGLKAHLLCAARVVGARLDDVLVLDAHVPAAIQSAYSLGATQQDLAALQDLV